MNFIKPNKLIITFGCFYVDNLQKLVSLFDFLKPNSDYFAYEFHYINVPSWSCVKALLNVLVTGRRTTR